METHETHILLIGETGYGKSSLGNFIIGKDAFETSNSKDSCTQEVLCSQSLRDPFIYIIDTPGMMDSNENDKKNCEKIFNFLNEKNISLELILIVFNYQQRRFVKYIQNMLDYLCKSFPDDFSKHIAFVFTFYDNEYETQKHKKNPKEALRKFINEIMEFIQKCSGESEVYYDVPIYSLDNESKDEVSEKEINNLIAFAKTLKPIKQIIKKNNVIKEQYYEYDKKTNITDKEDEIITTTEFFERKVTVLYDGSEVYSDWEKIDEEIKKQSKSPYISQSLINSIGMVFGIGASLFLRK